MLLERFCELPFSATSQFWTLFQSATRSHQKGNLLGFELRLEMRKMLFLKGQRYSCFGSLTHHKHLSKRKSQKPSENFSSWKAGVSGFFLLSPQTPSSAGSLSVPQAQWGQRCVIKPSGVSSQEKLSSVEVVHCSVPHSSPSPAYFPTVGYSPCTDWIPVEILHEMWEHIPFQCKRHNIPRAAHQMLSWHWSCLFLLKMSFCTCLHSLS